MESTVVQTEKVQSWSEQKNTRISLFRWQKWMDGEGRLWIITNLFGFDSRGRYGANVELLDVDNEVTVDIPREQVEEWVRAGNLKRIDTPILL